MPRQISYELTLDAHGPSELHVIDFEVRESLSEGCAVSVRAASASFLDGGTLTGKAAHLEVLFDDDQPRRWTGVVVTCTLKKTPSGANLLEVELRSRLWLLGLGRDNRIFTDTDVKKVVGQVLEKAGIAAAKQKWNVAKPPAHRPHIFQREESDLAFVQRLLAREGIGYAIHNDADGEQIVFFDDAASLPAIPGDPDLVDRSSLSSGTDIVFDVREKARVSSDKVMLRDYNPKLPGANMDVSAGSGARETYLHPGDYTEASGAGKRLADRALEALRVGTHGITGSSDCPRLEPGRHFTLGGHPRESLNASYLVVELLHRGRSHTEDDGDGNAVRTVAYENSFGAIAKAVPFRPPLAEPLRRGGEVVFVTGPAGEEIHVDEFGRVKVRFPWDRVGKHDDTSSSWLRVGQLALGGSMVLPRGGFEVIVDHELGDIDRPHVVGHLYNGKSPPPYALPQGATVTSLQTATTSGGPGANELRFEDAAGSEEIFFNASKDLTISVDHDASYSVGNNEKVKVGSNVELKVGTDFMAVVVSNRKLQVGATQSINVGGDLSETVGKDAKINVGGARKVQVGGDHGEDTAGKLSRSVGALQSVTGLKGFGRNVVGDSEVSAGAAWMEVVGRSRSSDVAGSRTETVGALKLIKAKSVSLSCGAALTVNAAAEMVTCAGSRVDASQGAMAITTGGGLSIKAATITIEAKDKLVMILGACVFKLESGGKIQIKAPTIEIKGAKALGQIMHGSN